MKTNSFQEIRAMWRLVAVCMFLMLAPLTLHAQQPLQLSPNALAQIAALQQEKASWTPIQQKVDSQLLLETKRNLNQAMAPGVPQLRRTVTIGPDGRTKIDIKANVTDALLQRIEALGGTVINSFPQYNAIQADMPLSQIQTLAAESDVAFIREAIPPMLNKVNTSEGDVAHAANTARGLYNVDGIGVKVGVLSDSASTSRLIALKASGDLPDATVLPGQAGSGSDEGAAMLEIVYDLAPGAELYFATAFSGQAGFATNIQALAAAGCQVIIDDVYYFAEPVFQDGIIAQAVDTVASSGVAYFSSAGNSGNLDAGTAGVWQGDFSGIPAPPVIGGTANDFGGGVNYDTITVDSPYCYTLQWSDPSAGSANDYDLYLLDPTLNIIIVSSTNVQNGTQDPYEYINSQYDDDTGNKLVIIKHAAAAGRYLHLNANRGMLAIATDGQTWGHACANGAFCVAAVSALTAHGVGGRFSTADTVETFSSDGPRRVFYNGAGIPYTPGNFSSTGGQVRQKPDITAADGVACATPGFNPFYGTSAAAPHAGAIAALLMDQGWAMTPAEIRQTLTSTSLDIQAANWDRNSGWGIIMADTALANASTYTVTFQTDGTPGATLTGTTPQIITFGANCTSVTANNPAGYHFVNWTKGGVDYSTNNPLTVNSVTEDMTLTANYAITTRTLTVKSQSPNSGVSITVSPLDNASQGNGDTQFTRNYNHGTTVTLTAPIAAPNGNAFYRWLIDGAEFAGNQSRPVQVLMNANRTMTAIYHSNQPILTIASQNPDNGVTVSVYPSDATGKTRGTTQFTCQYYWRSLPTLTATGVAPNGYVFWKWLKDGANFANNTYRDVLCSMDTDHTMTAVYAHPYNTALLTVASSSPASGAFVSVYPADKNNRTTGTTQFVCSYTPNSMVTLTARGTAPNGYVFWKWLRDGADFANNTYRDVLCSMAGDHTMTAVYRHPYNTALLTVASSNPDSGAFVSIYPKDNYSQTTGTTQFVASYAINSMVTLTARGNTPNGHIFWKWQRDGADFPNNTYRDVLCSMATDHTMTAIYKP